MMGDEQQKKMEDSYAEADLSNLLKQYYKRLFPTKLFCDWLCYGDKSYRLLGNREFSFTLEDDVYIRYLSFSNAAELEKELLRKIPYKIDIGAVYNYKPKEHKTLQPGVFKPTEKEVVFDIDMTDYDDVRTCCSGAAICKKCWPFMTVALKIIDKALEEDFGFQHRLWVYSGRRGIHCWVADEAARKLTQAGRSAVAEYLTLIKGSDSQAKKVNLKDRSLHPSIDRALDIVETYFEGDYLSDQEILSSAEKQQIMLRLIENDSVVQSLKSQWKDHMNSKQKWRELRHLCDDKNKASRRHTVKEIMLQYVYPRLDINVSKGLNHLLKSPFCVHPKTGRVCIPIDPKRVDDFDPFTVPTVKDLFRELDKHLEKGSTNENSQSKAYMNTSLAGGIEIFKRFINGLKKENEERRLKELKIKQEQPSYDF